MTIAKFIWEAKDKRKQTANLKWSIVKYILGYSNITKECLLCLSENLESINYPNCQKLFNYLLCTYVNLLKITQKTVSIDYYYKSKKSH